MWLIIRDPSEKYCWNSLGGGWGGDGTKLRAEYDVESERLLDHINTSLIYIYIYHISQRMINLL